MKVVVLVLNEHNEERAHLATCVDDIGDIKGIAEDIQDFLCSEYNELYEELEEEI